jgi:outer membrane protein assembly factor BamB
MPSPIVIDNNLYFFGNTATCYDKLTGKELYRKRTPGGTLVAGCPVVAGDRIVLVNEVGDVTIVTPGSEFEFREFKAPRELTGSDAPNNSPTTLVGQDEVFWATPGIANQSILIRSSDAIYCYR